MSRRRLYSTHNYYGWVTQNNLDDLCDEKRFVFKRFDSLTSLLGISHTRHAKQKAKDMFSDMMQMVAADMIEDRVSFVFPRRRSGYMYLGNINNEPGSERYESHVFNDFKIVGGKIANSSITKRLNGQKTYRFKMTREWIGKLRSAQYSGKQYVER